MLRNFIFLTTATLLFSACQRYPELFYYIAVQDAAGHNILATTDAPGKINVNDIVFERIYPDTTLIFHVAIDKDATADGTATTDSDSASATQDTAQALDVQGTAQPPNTQDTALSLAGYDTDSSIVATYGKDSVYHYAQAQYQALSETPHLWINGDVPIGVKLNECPPLIIHWPNGTSDTLQIENPNGTFGSVRYYINHQRVKDRDGLISITK